MSDLRDQRRRNARRHINGTELEAARRAADYWRTTHHLNQTNARNLRDRIFSEVRLAGYSIYEIADATGIPPNAVAKAANRGDMHTEAELELKAAQTKNHTTRKAAFNKARRDRKNQ